MEGVLIGKRYLTQQKIGSGSFGEIYLGVDLDHNDRVAIKFEYVGHCSPGYEQLEKEYTTYQAMQDTPGIPEVYHFQKLGDSFNVLVMELLSSNIGQLFDNSEHTFDMHTICYISYNVLCSLERIHSFGVIHRDVKPENFMLGVFDGNNLTNERREKLNDEPIYVIDLGLSKRYVDANSGDHIPDKRGKSLTGTARYASIRSHLGHEQSRRDDLESLAYMILYFLRGSLPWQGLPADTKKEKYTRILEKKQSTSTESLCKGFPEQFKLFLDSVRKLSFTADPPYAYYKQLFIEVYVGLINENKIIGGSNVSPPSSLNIKGDNLIDISTNQIKFPDCLLHVCCPTSCPKHAELTLYCDDVTHDIYKPIDESHHYGWNVSNYSPLDPDHNIIMEKLKGFNKYLENFRRIYLEKSLAERPTHETAFKTICIGKEVYSTISSLFSPVFFGSQKFEDVDIRAIYKKCAHLLRYPIATLHLAVRSIREDISQLSSYIYKTIATELPTFQSMAMDRMKREFRVTVADSLATWRASISSSSSISNFKKNVASPYNNSTAVQQHNLNEIQRSRSESFFQLDFVDNYEDSRGSGAANKISSSIPTTNNDINSNNNKNISSSRPAPKQISKVIGTPKRLTRIDEDKKQQESNDAAMYAMQVGAEYNQLGSQKYIISARSNSMFGNHKNNYNNNNNNYNTNDSEIVEQSCYSMSHNPSNIERSPRALLASMLSTPLRFGESIASGPIGSVARSNIVTGFATAQRGGGLAAIDRLKVMPEVADRVLRNITLDSPLVVTNNSSNSSASSNCLSATTGMENQSNSANELQTVFGSKPLASFIQQSAVVASGLTGGLIKYEQSNSASTANGQSGLTDAVSMSIGIVNGSLTTNTPGTGMKRRRLASSTPSNSFTPVRGMNNEITSEAVTEPAHSDYRASTTPLRSKGGSLGNV